MAITRYSQKELARQANAKVVIPENYELLKNGEMIHETEKAKMIEFTYDAHTFRHWFPISKMIEDGGKFYVEKWLIKKAVEI